MAPRTANPVVHLELHTVNLPAASEFYSELCGWHPEPIDVGANSYLSLDIGDAFGGGIVECPTRRPLWLPYVEVADIFAATELAVGLGASVLLGPREGPTGWRSVVTAPASGEVAFWQAKNGPGLRS